jgi:hypothetical protein
VKFQPISILRVHGPLFLLLLLPFFLRERISTSWRLIRSRQLTGVGIASKTRNDVPRGQLYVIFHVNRLQHASHREKIHGIEGGMVNKVNIRPQIACASRLEKTIIIHEHGRFSIETTVKLSSPGIAGPFVTVPSIRPPPPAPAAPTVPMEPWPPFTTLPFAGAPEAFAVPDALVPGALGVLDELPAPAGSLPALFRPAGFAGPDGTPFTP